MYPFSALPAPALPDEFSPSHSFVPLPLDTLFIVVRSIPPSERASLLNLALVNKSAYYATRQRRGQLALLAEDGCLKWESAQIQDARRLEHALHAFGHSDTTVSADAMQALLSHWMDKIFLPENLTRRGDWALSMLERLVQAACSLPNRQRSELPWKLLLAQGGIVNLVGDERESLMSPLEKAGASLPDEERQRFAFACRIARWRYECNFLVLRPNAEKEAGGRALTAANLHEAFDHYLQDPDAWPLEVQALMLDVIVIHLKRLSLQQRGELAMSMLKATDAWPALHRVRILSRLSMSFFDFGIGQDVAEAIVSRVMELERMLEELPTLDDADKLTLLHNLVSLMRDGRQLCARCGDEQAAAAALKDIASRIGAPIMAHLLALPYAEERHARLLGALENTLRTCFGWNTGAAKWRAGFEAICAAGRRVHGVSHGVLCAELGRILFRQIDSDHLAARRVALEPLLTTGPQALGPDREIAAWRLFISVIENLSDGAPGSPFKPNEATALRNAEALIAEPELMTPATWADMMCQTLTQLGTQEAACRIARQVLKNTAAIPEAVRAELLAHLVWLAESWEPAYQSSVIDLLLSVAADFAEREKARLLPEMVRLYLRAHLKNSDAKLWLPEIMRLFDDLPDPMKMRALEIVMHHPALVRADPAACAALLPELERKIAALPAPPQACLLLSLALCLDSVEDSLGNRMRANILARLDGLGLPREDRKAWQDLYHAACTHSRSGNAGKAPVPHADRQALPEALREPTQTMLSYIDKLPRYAKREAKVASKDSGCVIA